MKVIALILVFVFLDSCKASKPSTSLDDLGLNLVPTAPLSLLFDIPRELAENDGLVVVRVWREAGKGNCKMTTSDSSKLGVYGDGVVSFSKAFDLELAYLKIIDNPVKDDDSIITVSLQCTCEFTNMNVTFAVDVTLRDDDLNGYRSPLELSVIYPPKLFEGATGYFHILKLRGAGMCHIGWSDTEIHDFTKVETKLFGGNSAFFEKSITIKSDIISSKTVINLRISCLDNSTKLPEKYSIPITVLPYIENESYKAVQFQVQHPLKIYENGGLRSVSLRKISGLGSCDVKSVDKTELTVNGITHYSYNGVGVNGNIFQVEPINDNIMVGNRFTDIILECQCDLTGKNFEIPISILIIEDDKLDASILGDPHFSQMVLDENNYSKRSICFDVTGNSGDLIKIAEHLESETAIYGELLDDYYMHIITIDSKYGSVMATTKNITLLDGSHLFWGNRNSKIRLDDDIFSYDLVGNKLTVKVKIIEDVFFIIERLKRAGSYYLNIQIPGLEENYEQFDGLLGRVGNNRFEFYDSVQDSSVTRAAVRINGKIFSCSILNRSQKKCWLVKTREALYPYDSDDYIFPKRKLNIY